MSDTVMMPKLGFDMAEGTLVRWVKVEGENVSKGEVLAEIETDKATVEVESSFSGVMARHLVSQGDIVPVGTPIAIIAQPGEEVEASAEGTPAEQKAGKEQAVAAEKPAVAAEKPAVAAEKLAVAAEKLAVAAEKPAVEPQPAEESASSGDGRIKVSPLARRVAGENGIDLSRVKGSGPGGRIVRGDVEAAIQAGKKGQAPAAAPAPAPAAPAAAAPARPAPAPVPLAPVSAGAFEAPQDETIKVSRLRAAIGRRMVESKTQIPHFYVTRTYKFEKVMELRSQLNAYLPDDQKLTVNDFIIKAVGLTLRQFPNVNASLRDGEIIRHGHINIGSAVSIEGGLMTVVLRDADLKPLRLISVEMRELVSRAREGKVRTEDIEGSTFSISNMGMYDVDHFVAIINPPEAGILAVGSAMQVPVVEGGELKVGLRMKATISIDHRISDGAEADRCMQALAAYLEDPMRLML